MLFLSPFLMRFCILPVRSESKYGVVDYSKHRRQLEPFSVLDGVSCSFLESRMAIEAVLTTKLKSWTVVDIFNGFIYFLFTSVASKTSFALHTLAYQCAFVSLNSGVVENWKRISNIFMFPKMLDQWGFPKGSTVSLDEGTVHVTESFFFATSKYPPPSVVTSHQAFISKREEGAD